MRSGSPGLVRRKEVTRVALVEAAVEVAELQELKINAIAHRAYDQAIDEVVCPELRGVGFLESAASSNPVSYTHLTLPTTPYV